MSSDQHRGGLSSKPPPNRLAEWALLLVQLPGSAPKRGGVLLLDSFSDKLHIAVLERVSDDPDVAEIWAAVPEDLQERATRIGGGALFDILEQTLSNFLQIEGTRQQILIADPVRAVQILFEHHVLHGVGRSPEHAQGAIFTE